jgi:hypothetical protein
VSGLAHRDGRTLFERTWSYGIDSGLITEARRDAVLHEGTRSVRRIAGVLGSEFLRADLERAMRAMLGLVNLHLEKVSRGDLETAARSIADNGLLFHTRGASRAIKRVLASEEGLNPDELDASTQRRFEEAVVSEWAGFTFADFAKREQGADDARRTREAGHAIARMLRGQAPDPFEDPEKVIMTALLILACRKERAWIPEVTEFEALLGAIRASPALLQHFPGDVPRGHEDTLRRVWSAYVGKVRAIGRSSR